MGGSIFEESATTMSLEIKGVTGSSQKSDSGKQQNPLLESNIKNGKNLGQNGFSGLFGNVISVAKASFVPDLKNQPKDVQTKQPLVEHDRLSNGKNADRHDVSVREVGVRRQERSRDDENNQNPVGVGNEDNSDRVDHSARESQASADRNHNKDADYSQQEKDADYSQQEKDGKFVGSDEKSSQQNSQDKDKQVNAGSGDKSGEIEKENNTVPSEDSKAPAENNTVPSEASKALAENNMGRVAGFNQRQDSEVGAVVTSVENSKSDGITSLATNDLLGLLQALQNVLRLAIQSSGEGGVDGSKVVEKMAALVDGGLSVGEKQALLNIIDQLMVAGGKGAKLDKESLANSLSLEKIAKVLGDALQGSNSDTLARALAKVAGELDVPVLQDGKIDKSLLEQVQRSIARAISGTVGDDGVETKQKLPAGAKVTFEGAKNSGDSLQKTGLFDSRVLNELQGIVQNGTQKDTSENIPDDLRLRASRTFVDSDAKRADNVIVKTTGNLLNQLSSVAAADDTRIQTRQSLERLVSSSDGAASLAKQVSRQSFEGRSSEQARVLNDLLVLSRGLDGKGQVDRFGEGGLVKQSGSNLGVSGQLNSLSNQATNAMKNPNTNGNRPGQLNDVQEQVRVNVQRAINSGQDRIRLQLRPGQLGRVDIRINILKDGTYALRVFVEKQESLDVLRNDSKGLIDSLRESGIKAGEENLEFSLQEGGKEQEQEPKKKKSFGHQLEIEEEQTVPTADNLSVAGIDGELDSDSSSSEDDRLNVVV